MYDYERKHIEGGFLQWLKELFCSHKEEPPIDHRVYDYTIEEIDGDEYLIEKKKVLCIKCGKTIRRYRTDWKL
mgnify:CR=1 FL=1